MDLKATVGLVEVSIMAWASSAFLSGDDPFDHNMTFNVLCLTSFGDSLMVSRLQILRMISDAIKA